MLGYENLGRIVYMSLILCIHTSLTSSMYAIFAEIFDQKGYLYIGQIILMVEYTMELVGNMNGQKFFSLQRSGLSFFVCGLLPILIYIPAIILNRCLDKEGICSYYSIIAISIICQTFQGLGYGTYYLLCNCYQSACANNKSRDILNGISYTLIGLSYLVGYSFSEMLISYVTREKFFIVLAVTQFCINMCFLGLPNPSKNYIQDEVYGKRINNSSVRDEFLTVLTNFDVTNKETVQETLNQSQSPKAIYPYLWQPAVQMLLAYFFLTGLVIGFSFGQFYQVILNTLPVGLDQITVNQKTFVVFIYFGLGEILTGPFIALLRGRVDLSNYLRLYPLIVGLTLILTVINVYVKSYEFCYAIAICWGMSDNFGQTTSHLIISKQWGENVSLFGLYLIIQNLGSVVYLLFAIFFSYTYMIYGLLFFFSIVITSVIHTHIFIEKYYLKHSTIQE